MGHLMRKYVIISNIFFKSSCIHVIYDNVCSNSQKNSSAAVLNLGFERILNQLWNRTSKFETLSL